VLEVTALKPIENRRVRGVAAERYPTNTICAHPDCSEPVEGDHHIFPSSLTKSRSYFVEIAHEDRLELQALVGPNVKIRNATTGSETVYVAVLPHAVGLCGSGTTGHHGDVEEHRAWIKLEGGVFVWYDRSTSAEIEADPDGSGYEPAQDRWDAVGPLNPQPGSVEGKPKRKRTVKGTGERKKVKTITVRLPEGFSGEDWDELYDKAVEVELEQKNTQFDPKLRRITIGKLVVAVFQRFTDPTYGE
jgi:hypothetical protein